MRILLVNMPSGFGVRQSSGAFHARKIFQSGRGLPQSKTLARQADALRFFA